MLIFGELVPEWFLRGFVTDLCWIWCTFWRDFILDVILGASWVTFVCHFNMIYVDFSRPCSGVVFERFCVGFVMDLVHLLEAIWALFLSFYGIHDIMEIVTTRE